MKKYVIFVSVALMLTGCGTADATMMPTNSYRQVEPVKLKNNDEDPQYFKGYECTDDCSGHEAGYEWAEENGIANEDDCDGKSDSFIEGCRSYVEENY